MTVGAILPNRDRSSYYGRLLAVCDACRQEREGKNHHPGSTYFDGYPEILSRPAQIETQFARTERQHFKGNNCGEMTKEVQGYLSDKLSEVLNQKPSHEQLLKASIPVREDSKHFEDAYSSYLKELTNEVEQIKEGS